MLAESKFSYVCNRCGLCCRNKVITLSPYDVVRISRAAQISTGETVARYTLRRGSLLRFLPDGRCAALDAARCTVHPGRPLACRLYPLGLERVPGRGSDPNLERFAQLEPAVGSLGVYGSAATITEFLDGQDVAPYLYAIGSYYPLVAKLSARVAAIVDFERVEPREFWRRAAREALAEANYDPNVLIDAMFDPDGFGCGRSTPEHTVTAHVAALAAMISNACAGPVVAAAAVMLAISLGYAPGAVAAISVTP
jgi:Fe-S-cluster containining protein